MCHNNLVSGKEPHHVIRGRHFQPLASRRISRALWSLSVHNQIVPTQPLLDTLSHLSFLESVPRVLLTRPIPRLIKVPP